ncbi:hypothetical protein ACFV3R_12215 [Streptomyces sp. NPDC059740]|uniref:hypothetical protein n=1 Tax=Streptomyces sp. NPDC059740 TaxID=3346926 RepID=UPI00365DD8E0
MSHARRILPSRNPRPPAAAPAPPSASPRSRHRRVLAALAAFLLGAAGLILAGPAPEAAAAAQLVTCPVGTETTTYSPGLRLPQAGQPNVHLQAQGSVGPCVSLDLRHTGGQVVINGSGPLNCLGGNSSGTGRLTWANPGTHPSLFTFTGGISLRPDGVTVLVLTGKVTSGDYTGATLVQTVVLASTDLTACLTPGGLTTSSGLLTVTLTDL